jgi:hypothetical protein
MPFAYLVTFVMHVGVTTFPAFFTFYLHFLFLLLVISRLHKSPLDFLTSVL